MTMPDEDDDDFAQNDPDYDLSEAHGYTWEPAHEYEGPVPRWLIILITLAVVLALLVPGIIVVIERV
jgi:hypothetical protein